MATLSTDIPLNKTAKKLAYNFETDNLSIIANQQLITENNDVDIHFVNISNDKFCVIRVDGICTSDNQFTLITERQFYKIIDDYIKEFKIKNEEIEISYKNLNLEELNIYEKNYKFNADLCSFTLYKITM